MDKDVKQAEIVAETGKILVEADKSNFTWDGFKSKLICLIGSLIMEKDDNGKWQMSAGRLAWWMAFLPAVGIWLSGQGNLESGSSIKDISPNHFNTLVFLAAYNFSKKGLQTIKQVLKK